MVKPQLKDNSMDIQTYRADSLQEALAEVRRTLGPDASILETRTCRAGWLSWLPGGQQVEVLASRTIQVPSRVNEAGESTGRQTDSPPAAADQRPLESGLLDHWRSQLDQQGPSLIADLAERGDTAVRLAGDPLSYRLSHYLSQQGIPDQQLASLFEHLTSADTPWQTVDAMHAELVSWLATQLQVSDSLSRPERGTRTAALVGPSGTGKTSTLIKLAVQLQQQQRCKVGLITTDISRVTAVDQLRSYAEMFELELAVAATPREMQRAREQMADRPLLLLDTPGSCPGDRSSIRQLGVFLAEAEVDDVLLVLNASSSIDNMRESVEGFGLLGITSLVLTKFDEARRLGQLLPMLEESYLPVGYVTDGQGIPQDLQAAEPGWLAARLLAYPPALDQPPADHCTAES